MLQPPEPPKYNKIPLMDDAGSRKEAPLKRKAQANKVPKPRKPKKVAATRNEMGNGSVSRGRNVRKSLDVVIIGIHLDISGIPTSVCSCTGTPYWLGVGGWHPACCTTSISMYPAPACIAW